MPSYKDIFSDAREHAESDVVRLDEIQRLEDAFRQPGMREILFGSFELMQQWYSGEIKYLTKLGQVLKINEVLTPEPIALDYTYCTYRVNFIPPQTEWPDPGDHNYGYRFNKPGFISEETDWNPNVAFQLTTRMTDAYTGGSDVSVLKPIVEMKVWGRVEQYEGIPNSHTSLKFRSGNGKIGSVITIQGEVDNPQSTLENVRNALICVTPNVLRHKQIIQGQ
jgi:hypothetical protein